MKKIFFTIITISLLLQIKAFAQDERLIPSYDENSGYIRDYPEVDIDVHPYINTWKKNISPNISIISLLVLLLYL